MAVRQGLAELEEWISKVWSDAYRLEVLDGGEGDGPLAGRTVLAATVDSTLLRQLRSATTSGSFVGGICRCAGQLTLVLYASDGRILGSGSIHGGQTVSWGRDTFGNDLKVDDPAELSLALISLGVSGQASILLSRLLDVLDLHEGDVQFRPASECGSENGAMRNRRVPSALWPELCVMSGEEVGGLDDVAVTRFRRRVINAYPDPVDRATKLLAWLGGITWPGEALSGDGVLVRHLLDDIDHVSVLLAARDGTDDAVLMGSMVWGAFLGDDVPLLSLVGEKAWRRVRV